MRSKSCGGPSAVMVLVVSSRNRARSATAKTLAISCVTITTVVPRWCLRLSTSSSSRAAFTGSSPAPGSSRNSRVGSSASARASAARLRMPPDSAAGARSKAPSSPTRASLNRARRSRSAASSVVNSSNGSIRLRPRLIELQSAPAWNITPKRRRRAACSAALPACRSSPSINTLPAAGCSRPTRWRSSVLLPQPLAPMMTSTSPGSTSKSNPCCTRRPPASMARPRTCTRGVAAVSGGIVKIRGW